MIVSFDEVVESSIMSVCSILYALGIFFNIAKIQEKESSHPIVVSMIFCVLVLSLPMSRLGNTINSLETILSEVTSCQLCDLNKSVI